jgi:hypothetical protein
MENSQKEMEQAQMVFKALQQQRKGALLELEKRAEKLLDGTDKLTKPELEGEEGAKILANILREVVSAINSAHIALDTHDKLLDMLIQDLGKVVDQAQAATNGLLHVSVMSEVMMQVLLSKDIFTEEDLKEAHKKVSAATRDTINRARSQEDEGSLKI